MTELKTSLPVPHYNYWWWKDFRKSPKESSTREGYPHTADLTQSLKMGQAPDQACYISEAKELLIKFGFSPFTPEEGKDEDYIFKMLIQSFVYDGLAHTFEDIVFFKKTEATTTFVRGLRECQKYPIPVANETTREVREIVAEVREADILHTMNFYMGQRYIEDKVKEDFEFLIQELYTVFTENGKENLSRVTELIEYSNSFIQPLYDSIMNAATQAEQEKEAADLVRFEEHKLRIKERFTQKATTVSEEAD